MTKNKSPTTQNLDRLLVIFSGKRIAFWVFVALAVHVGLIGGCSLNTIRDRWDPEGAEQRERAAQVEQQRLAKEAAAAAAPAIAGLTNAAAVVSDVNAPAAPDAIPADRADTPTAQRITEVAKPEEMPKLGNDLGISIEDTSIR